MEEFIHLIKTAFPEMAEATRYRIALLQHQYQDYLLGEDVGDFDQRVFQRLEREDAGYAKASGPRLPLELQVAAFLADPGWTGRESLETTIKRALDRTMIADELEELRRIYLQNAHPAPATADVRLAILTDPRWSWTLNPRWLEVTDADERLERLKLKHQYFHEIGWLRDPTENNPVIRFQLTYLRNPRISLEELLRLDMELPHGSEIFHRIRDANPFLISYIYSLFKEGGRAALSEWALEDA